MITRNASVFVVLELLVLALALALGNVVLLGVAMFTFFLAIMGLTVLQPSRVEVRRSLSRATVWVDEQVRVTWEVDVTNGLGPVIVHDALPHDMSLADGVNLRVYWKGLKAARFTNSYALQCPKRGRYKLTETEWETRHPFDFRQPERGSTADAPEINVLPRLVAIRRVANVRTAAHSPTPMGDLTRMGVTTTDFREMREYVLGDPVRNINWKATARQAMGASSRPIVNVFEKEGKKAIWLFCDSSRYMGVGTSVRNPLEHTVETASALGYYYLSRGYALGAHFSSRPTSPLYPDIGSRQFMRLTNVLLTLRPEGTHYDLPRAIQACRAQLLRYKPRCVVITRLDADDRESQSLTQQYETLLAGVSSLVHFSAMIIAINGYHYGAGDGASATAAKHLRTLETRPVVRALRRKGVEVLEWDPFREQFARTLLRQLRVERSRR